MRYSPDYSPSRRGPYRVNGRSPPRRGYGGGVPGRRKEQTTGSLLVRNIPLDCSAEQLRIPFERYGNVRDVYIPRDYYSGEPRGFAFVEFVDPYDAYDAQRCLNGQYVAGREISVVIAAETRKRPEEMRQRARFRGQSSHERPPHYGRALSPSPSPRRIGSRTRYRSRSFSPVPRYRDYHEYSPSPRARINPPVARYDSHRYRSISPAYRGAPSFRGDSYAYDHSAYLRDVRSPRMRS